jgi:hypothetical protein
MHIHILNLLQMGIGICLLFFAIYLWSIFRKLSSVFLALTSFLMYCSIVTTLLDQYGVFKTSRIFRFYDIPVIDRGLQFLILIFLIVTVSTFIRDEKRDKGN